MCTGIRRADVGIDITPEQTARPDVVKDWLQASSLKEAELCTSLQLTPARACRRQAPVTGRTSGSTEHWVLPVPSSVVLLPAARRRAVFL